ncbi:MAG TPA: hypothetical protein VMV45_08755 [Casimicrobiaceae bacterium]|nr:hypothetical protein [Casimicrobiaceae bacterium]
MSTHEVFRYSWMKVTDANGRASAMRAALELQPQLAARARVAEAGSAEARFVRMQSLMARSYLGGDIERGIRVVVAAPPHGGSLSLDILAPAPHTVSRDGIEVSVATMPSGYTREDALAWLDTPVGLAWSRDALACRLAHAVVMVEDAPLASTLDNAAEATQA